MRDILTNTVLVFVTFFMVFPHVVNCEEPFQYRLRQILLEPTVSPESRNEILARTQACFDAAVSGEDFTVLAKRFSEEPGADRTGGDLGFFTREQMVKPFSDAVFSMKPGDIAGPVETQYGYHIIKLLAVDGDRRHTQHILFSLTPSSADTVAVMDTLMVIRDLLRAGEPFDEIFDRYNHNDLLSATKGYLVWQRPEDMLPSFRDHIGVLQPGQITEPFSSIVGLHIVMVDSINYNRDLQLEGFPPGLPLGR